MNRKPMEPNNSAHIKTHKINEQIRPLINNIREPYYKVENYLNKKLKVQYVYQIHTRIKAHTK